jgi:hypothetical protein
MMMYNAGLPALWKRGICAAGDTRTMAWGGEPGEYARRILGMAYILDGKLTGEEVQSSRAPAQKKPGKTEKYPHVPKAVYQAPQAPSATSAK